MSWSRVVLLAVLHVVLALTIGIGALAVIDSLLWDGTPWGVADSLARVGGQYVYAIRSGRGTPFAICVTVAMLGLPAGIALWSAIRVRRGRSPRSATVAGMAAVAVIPVVFGCFAAMLVFGHEAASHLSVQGLLGLTAYEVCFAVWAVLCIPVAALAHRVALATRLVPRTVA